MVAKEIKPSDYTPVFNPHDVLNPDIFYFLTFSKVTLTLKCEIVHLLIKLKFRR